MRQKYSITSPTKVEQETGASVMSRIVQCPKCRVLLQEPPPGNPYYQCGSCSTTLQAKHATKADLESTNIRFSHPGQNAHHRQQVDKQTSKGSKPDSSSGEISEQVGDDYAFGGDGAPLWSAHRKEGPAGPMYGRTRSGVGAAAGHDHFRPSSEHLIPEIQHSDQGGRGYNTMATNHHQPSQLMMNYDLEVDRTQPSAYGADYDHRRIASAAVGGKRYSSPTSRQEASSYGSPGFIPNPSRHQPMAPPRTAASNRENLVRADSEGEAVRAYQANANFILQYQKELQRTRSDPVTGSEQQQLNSQSLKTGAAETGEASSSTSTGPTLTSSASAISSSRTSKLKWQPRPEPVEKQPVSSPRAVEVVMSSRGLVDDDRITSGLSHEDRAKDTGEYVPERNWRGFPSRRVGKHDDNRDHGDEQQQHIHRTQSDGSEKNFDMYDSPSAYGAGPGPEHEASETSSTMDEGEGNEGGGNVGRFSPPPLHLPDLRAGNPRSQSHPIPPRSNVSSGRVSGHSEDGNPNASKMPTDLDSLDSPNPHMDKVNRPSRRQNSWDGTRMVAPSSSSNTNSPVPGTELRLRKSSSDDYANMISEQHQPGVHSRISSDPTLGDVYHQWVARLKPQQQATRSVSHSAVSSPKGSPSGISPRPPPHGQWERSSSGSNLQPPSMEPNPLTPSQHPGSHPASPPAAPQPPPNQHPSAVAGGGGGGVQLPPKQVNYPPLPPPGALPHVHCQHCHTLLAVPVNLPPPKKSTQRLRCGACMKISTFSVRQYSSESSYTAPRSDVQYGQSLFASSPDAHESSTNPGYRTTSGRSLSATSDELRRSGRRISDLSDKSLPIMRNDSLGSADMPSDEEMAERVLKTDIHSFSNPVISTSPECHHSSDGGVRSYSDGHSASTSRFSRVASPGPLYPKRGASLEHGPGSGSGSGSGFSARHQTEERSRFAADNRPSSRRHEEGVTSSDSESEHHQTLPHGSPQMDGPGHHRYTPSGSSSRSPPHHHAHSPPMPASGPGEHSGKEHAHHEPHRGFNKALKGIIHFKTSLRDLTHRSHKDHTNHVRSRVTVNGVPIPDNVVKRAEDLAGPILPGNYWYDEHAGFWGVQGGQCEGIIPPYIEELRHPMSPDCASGRTGVLVNGRELHIKDLEILVKRGLPNIPGRAYRIDIDGKVVNETTREELRGLGRLAPTLEHTRRGAGMFTR